MSVYIIAEAGVNHNGSLELAFKLVDEAKKCGADCVKFQTFKAEKMVTKYAEKAKYQNKFDSSNTQFEMLKKLELSYSDFRALKEYCKSKKIDFLSTPFDDESIDFLQNLGVSFWKIPSSDLNNYPYLVRIARTKMPVVLSTGMSTMEDIKESINVLLKNGSSNITLLHCNTEYPTPFSDVNLLAMVEMKKTFGVDVGYSDHTTGIEVPIAAVALGATIIEKHFTIDKEMDGPDHKASLEPCEFKKMVDSIRNIERALGSPCKSVTQSEAKNISIARKSIVAKKFIKKGERICEDEITTKRPGTGLSPMKWNEVVGSIAKKDFEIDDLIEL